MNDEFADTNIFLYAHDPTAGIKKQKSEGLIKRLVDEKAGASSIQVLAEFYSTATKKLRMRSEDAEQVIRDLASWKIHRPAHADVLKSIGIQRLHQISWWDAMIVNSAIELGCSTLWTEDLNHGQRFGPVTIRNPFR